MTKQEALRELKSSIEGCGFQCHLEVYKMAIEALEKDDKYRWHDLRKNPNDLPSIETKVEVCCKYKNRDYKIYTHGFYEDGTVLEEDSKWIWYDIDGEYDEEHDCYIISEGWWEYSDFLVDDIYNNVIDAEVLAWRYIEPFEEEVTMNEAKKSN